MPPLQPAQAAFLCSRSTSIEWQASTLPRPNRSAVPIRSRPSFASAFSEIVWQFRKPSTGACSRIPEIHYTVNRLGCRLRAIREHAESCVHRATCIQNRRERPFFFPSYASLSCFPIPARHDSGGGGVDELLERYPDGNRVLPRGSVQPAQFDEQRSALGEHLEVQPDDAGRLPARQRRMRAAAAARCASLIGRFLGWNSKAHHPGAALPLLGNARQPVLLPRPRPISTTPRRPGGV